MNGGCNWWKHSGFAAEWLPSESTGLATSKLWYFVHPGTLCCIARLCVTGRTLEKKTFQLQATQLSFMSFLLNSFYTALIHYKQFMKYHSLFCELRPVRYFAMISRLHWKLFPRHQDNKNIYKLLIEIYSLCFFGYFPRMRPLHFLSLGNQVSLGRFQFLQQCHLAFCHRLSFVNLWNIVVALVLR